jgi:hypothetical protein
MYQIFKLIFIIWINFFQTWLKAFKDLGYLIYVPLNIQFLALSTTLHLIPKTFSLTPIPTWYQDLSEIMIFYLGRIMISYLDFKSEI